MEGIPVIVFAGYSGSGKTTLIEAVIPRLTAVGFRVAAVKHDAHGEAFDTAGSDSARLFEAGAAVSVISGPGRTSVTWREPEPKLEKLLARISGVDLILVEGYKRSDYTKLGLCRRDSGKSFTDDLSRFAAVISDEMELNCTCPVFHPDDADGIARFILDNLNVFSRFGGDTDESPSRADGI